MGITLEYDYNKRQVTFGVPGYLDSVFLRQQHPIPTKPEFAPHDYTTIRYGQQYVTEQEEEDRLPNKEITTVQ